MADASEARCPGCGGSAIPWGDEFICEAPFGACDRGWLSADEVSLQDGAP